MRCELCTNKASHALGNRKPFFWVCGVHERYMRRRIPDASLLLRIEIRERLGFLLPAAAVQKDDA